MEEKNLKGRNKERKKYILSSTRKTWFTIPYGILEPVNLNPPLPSLSSHGSTQILVYHGHIHIQRLVRVHLDELFMRDAQIRNPFWPHVTAPTVVDHGQWCTTRGRRRGRHWQQRLLLGRHMLKLCKAFTATQLGWPRSVIEPKPYIMWCVWHLQLQLMMLVVVLILSHRIGRVDWGMDQYLCLTPNFQAGVFAFTFGGIS